MPRSDRSLIVAAIFGLVTIPFGVGLTLGGDWASKPYEQSEKPSASAEHYRAIALDTKFAAYPIEESNRCYAAKDHDSADLCAQWRAAIAAEKAANAAAWSNRLSIIGAALTLEGLGFIYWTFRETQRTANAAIDGVNQAGRAADAAHEANKIAREAMQRERAWIKIDTVRIKWVRFERADNRPNNPEYFHVSIEVDVRNVGSVPAIFVHPVPMAWLNSVGETGFNEWREHWLSAVVAAKGRATTDETFGHTMFPGDARTFPSSFSTLTSNVPGTLPVDSAYEFGVRLFVSAIIFYRFADSDLHHSLANTVMAIGNISDWSKGEPRKGDDLSPSRVTTGDVAA
ncbi:MAG: hypothetical protein ABI471_03550 [Sphingomonas bacterium]